MRRSKVDEFANMPFGGTCLNYLTTSRCFSTAQFKKRPNILLCRPLEDVPDYFTTQNHAALPWCGTQTDGTPDHAALAS